MLEVLRLNEPSYYQVKCKDGSVLHRNESLKKGWEGGRGMLENHDLSWLSPNTTELAECQVYLVYDSYYYNLCDCLSPLDDTHLKYTYI